MNALISACRHWKIIVGIICHNSFSILCGWCFHSGIPISRPECGSLSSIYYDYAFATKSHSSPPFSAVSRPISNYAWGFYRSSNLHSHNFDQHATVGLGLNVIVEVDSPSRICQLQFRGILVYLCKAVCKIFSTLNEGT